MTRQMTLQELYNKFKKEYQKSGTRPRPTLLLTLLLLQDKDKFNDTVQSFYDFYNKNKIEIDKKIEQVMKDFAFTLKKFRKNCYLSDCIDDGEVILKAFEDGIYMLANALHFYPNLSPEEMYNGLLGLTEWDPLPEIRDNEIPYSKLSPLQRKYRQYLNRYKRDGKLPHPAKLLALLILDDKDRYIYLCDEERDEEYINDKIKQLMTDFSLTELSLFMEYPTKYGQLNIKDEVGVLENPKIKENVFDKALIIISGELYLSPSSSSEILYDKFCALFKEDNLNLIDDYFMEPQIEYNRGTKKYKYPKLDELYAYYLDIFEKTGKHPHPSELLALLLLPEKDKFYPILGSAGEFYTLYKETIDKKINQVCTDFNITKQDIIEYIEELGYDEEDYEYGKIWHVFDLGFGIVQWANRYYPNWSPEKIHCYYSERWDRMSVPEDLIEKLPKQTVSRKRNNVRRRIPTITRGFK